MKNTLLFCAVLAVCAQLHAQTNIFPASGNAGIGTTSPLTTLEVTDNGGAYLIGTNSSYWSGFKTTAPTGVWGFQQNERAFFGVS